jgi:hypothetical protein
MVRFPTENWERVVASGYADGTTYMTADRNGIDWTSHGVWCAACGEAGQLFNRGQADHEANADPVADRLRRYDAASNSWTAINAPQNGNHGYSATAIDPAGKRVFSVPAGDVSPINVWDGETMTHLGTLALPDLRSWANTWAITIHPNLGPHGRLFLVHLHSGINDLWVIDLPESGIPDPANWSLHSGADNWDGTTGGRQGSGIAHYHPTLDAILFGATGPDLNEIWQVDSTGTLSQLDDSRVPFKIPATNDVGGHLIPVPNEPYWEYWAVDPDIDATETRRYRLDPNADPGSQWTDLGALDKTPEGYPQGGRTTDTQHHITFAIPEHDVTLVAGQGVTMLFKH